MAVKAARAPYIGDFGGYTFVESNGWLVCPEKKVKISIICLRDGVKNINEYPKGHKFAVGVTTEGPQKPLYMWREDFTTYIECLSEPTIEFSKKYQKLIKHLNGK